MFHAQCRMARHLSNGRGRMEASQDMGSRPSRFSSRSTRESNLGSSFRSIAFANSCLGATGGILAQGLVWHMETMKPLAALAKG